ncbi:MAG: hypothetical protein DRP01_03230 [Archaeoglobales archaeon]|nr:MAG: hypothetical protein DRP01_03230 [Archaeoglobales archaeon]
MSFDLSKLIHELRRQKQKYHAKTLSTQGIETLWFRILQTEDLYPEFVWLILPDFDFTALAFSLLFDIPPIEFDTINLNFEPQLPDLSKLLQGILIDIQKIDFSEIYEWLKDVEEMIEENIKEELQESITSTRPRKAVYGETKYGYSYYDPPAIREFLKSTFIRFFLERGTIDQLIADFKRAREVLGVNEDFTRMVFNRLSMVSSAQTEALILGYGVLGHSKLAEKGSRLGKVRFIDYDKNIQEIHVNTLDHLQIGFILGLTPLGYGFLVPYSGIYKSPSTTVSNPFAGSTTTPGSPSAIRMVEDRCRRVIRQYRYNPFSLANYNRPNEQRDYRYSERADQWFALQELRYLVENLADPIIRKYEANPVKIRMYKSAILQLISAKAKRHKWGYKGFQAMTEEEFYNWWLEHWRKQGLNTQVLQEIYSRIKRWIPEWRKIKFKLGSRVRERRYSLAVT